MIPGKQVNLVPREKDTLNKAFWCTDGYHPGGLFNLAKPDAKYICPSVFKKFVSRTVTFQELLQCMDISPDQGTVQPRLKNTNPLLSYRTYPVKYCGRWERPSWGLVILV
jgi:hypothetical protein